MNGIRGLLAQEAGNDASASVESASDPPSLPHGQFILDYLLVIALVAGALYAVCRPSRRA